ncbi:MAG: lipopolysaccharide heptosyltransferase II [Candidatus Omnitrophica bacterium CG11_big_fil_rev_8_21_14_0_20_63_9]|nr:MAG: lipopolysaccharide heptosyltransferase II [Candidatus Omnitrophica bacterium CG11_big_fil_rev_8_21_14_0_20_63_9]
MNRILVVLPNWFGETLFVTPFLRSLRRQRPGAYIAALGWPRCHDVLQHNPHVDALLPLDEHEAHRGLRGLLRLARELRAQRFDAAFILRKSLTRSLVLAMAGIPVRVGFANAKSGWLLTHRVPASRLPQHKAISYLPLLGALGLSAMATPYDWTVTEEERHEAQARLNELMADWSGPLVVLHPGANWPHKRWMPQRFGQLGDRLIETHHAQIVITGSPDDVPLAREVAGQMRHPAVVLAGATTLRQMAACLEQARLVVSNDTGVLHIAAALRRPVVALYGPTSPILTGPLGDPQRTIVLHHAQCCPRIPCYEPDRPPHPGMRTISVDEVYAAVCKLLEQRA